MLRVADTSLATRPRLVADVAVPALIRALEMLVQLAVLAWLNGNGPSLTDRLLKWDGLYYLQIVRTGYSSSVTVGADGSLKTGNEIAFHPLYPALAAVLHVVLPADVALLCVTVASGLLASVAVHRLAFEVLGSRRAGYIACSLLGALPLAITLQMGYAESLFLALTAFALLFAWRMQWWPAAGFVFAAGLTRPTGLVLAVVIPLTAWMWQRRGRSMNWRPVIAATVIGALGVPAYWVFLWVRTGRPDAWFVVEQHGWNSHFDFGAATVSFLRDTLGRPDGLVGPVVCAIIIGYLLAAVLVVVNRWPLPISGLLVLSVLLALTSTNYWHSKPRLLLTAFIVLLPAAAALNRFRTPTVIALIGAGVFASAWFGAYMLTVWQYAI